MARGDCYWRWHSQPSVHRGQRAGFGPLCRALCQEAGPVPIVEPEVLMDGEHTLEQCRAATEHVLHNVFAQLYTQRVMLEGMIVTSNMVLAGLASSGQETVAEVAETTVQCLPRVVPAAVPGIAFLSGGQPGDIGVSTSECHERAGKIAKISAAVGTHFLVCPCNPTPCFGYLAWPGRQCPSSAASSVASGQMQPGGTAWRLFCCDGTDMTLRLYLIRHGETEWSLSGQHTGRTDLPLTAHGEDEARKLVPWLRHIRFARVLTSPLQRARRTCELAGLGGDGGG